MSIEVQDNATEEKQAPLTAKEELGEFTKTALVAVFFGLADPHLLIRTV